MNKERYDQIIDEVYENYKKDQNGIIGSDWTYRLSTPSGHDLFRLYTKEEFVEKCKKDPKFWSEWSLSEKWGLKIEERELSLEERLELADKINTEIRQDLYSYAFNNPIYTGGVNQRPDDVERHELLSDLNIPTKIIEVTYNNETIEVYE